MTYGSTLYGSGALQPGNNLIVRTRRFLRSGPNATTLSRILSLQLQALADLADRIASAFSLTGTGEILDRLGGILQRPRPANYTDADYQTLLAVQVELILSSTASDETLLAIVSEFTGSAAPEYIERAPAEIEICASVENDRVELLLSLLRRAKAGGVFFTLVEAEPDTQHLIGDLVTDTYADPGVGDLVTDTYADAYTGVRVHR